KRESTAMEDRRTPNGSAPGAPDRATAEHVRVSCSAHRSSYRRLTGPAGLVFHRSRFCIASGWGHREFSARFTKHPPVGPLWFTTKRAGSVLALGPSGQTRCPMLSRKRG